MGVFFFTEKFPAQELCAHEFGHGIQNCVYGIFMIPLICIPSAIRYWYYEIIWRINQEKYYKLPDYDAIWFEGQATKWGTQMMNKIKVL